MFDPITRSLHIDRAQHAEITAAIGGLFQQDSPRDQLREVWCRLGHPLDGRGVDVFVTENSATATDGDRSARGGSASPGSAGNSSGGARGAICAMDVCQVPRRIQDAPRAAEAGA